MGGQIKILQTFKALLQLMLKNEHIIFKAKNLAN